MKDQSFQDARRLEITRFSEELELLCRTLGPGGQLPRHTELMRRFSASERTVLGVLNDFKRAGRVIRQHGIGTFVAEPPIASGNATLDRRTVVAIRVPDNSFFDTSVDLLFHHTDAAGLSLVCSIVSQEHLSSFTLPCRADQPLGFIMFRYSLFEPLARQILRQGGRAVILGAPPAGVTPEVPCIYGDHVRGGYAATCHLINLGHRRIAFLTPEGEYQERMRWQGNLRAILEAERAGLSIEYSFLSVDELGRWERDAAPVRAYCQRPDAPTGVVAWNDEMALRLIVALNRAGIRVPSDISVVGYDALPEGQRLYPQLTTVEQSLDWQLETALGLLMRPEPPAASHIAVVLPVLLPRESTAPPRESAISPEIMPITTKSVTEGL